MDKWLFVYRHIFGSSGALVIVGSHELWPQILKVHLSATVLYRWTGLFARPIKKEVPVEGIRVFLSYWPSWQHSSAVTFGFVGPGIIWFQTWDFIAYYSHTLGHNMISFILKRSLTVYLYYLCKIIIHTNDLISIYEFFLLINAPLHVVSSQARIFASLETHSYYYRL